MILRQNSEIVCGCSRDEMLPIPCTERELSAAFDNVATRIIGTREAPADLMPRHMNPRDYWGTCGVDEIITAMDERGAFRNTETEVWFAATPEKSNDS